MFAVVPDDSYYIKAHPLESQHFWQIKLYLKTFLRFPHFLNKKKKPFNPLKSEGLNDFLLYKLYSK